MKALIAKIRRILRNRRTRLMLSRTVSIVAAFVVFVTTYALVLPAITMEKDAKCGVEAHQHDDSCYELQLTCTQAEADGHVHTEDCYQVEQVLTCEIPEHQHSAENGCYDEEGNLVCTETEHVHDSRCYRENRELVCGLEQSGGHHHNESCYEKVLICGKQVHTHGPECYEDDAGAADPGFTDGEGIVGPGTVGTESGGNESGQGDFGGDDQGGNVFDGQEYDFGAGDQGGSQFNQDPGSTDFGGDDFGGNDFEGRDDFSGGMEFIDAEPGGDSFDGGENWDADFTEETVFTDAEPPQQLYEEPYEEPYEEAYQEPVQEPYEEPYQEPYEEPIAEEAPVENGALTGQDDQNVQESGEGPAPEGNPAEGDEAEAGQAGDQTVENAESAGTETDAAAADQDAESQDAMGQDTADPETADLEENQQALDNEIDKEAEKEAGEKTEAAEPEDDKAGDRETADNTDNKEETDNKEADKKEAGQDGKDDQDTSGTADSAKSNTGAAPADKTDTKPESTGYAAETTAADAYVPALDALDFNAILDKNTGIYYHAVEEGGVIEDSSVLYDWEKVKKDTELAPNDLLRIYLSYTIPAGSLNATNDIARYRLPGNIHLSDAQKAAINGFENGISGQYMNYDALEITDPGRHTAYIGAEAVEGRRRPGQTVEDYLAGLDKNEDGTDPQELISAVVRTEDVCDAEGSYIGTDLVFTFSTYTVERNQHEYDKDGNQTKAGEKVCGWFCFDLNTSQIDWSTVNVEESLYAVEAEGNTAEENGTAGSGADENGTAGSGADENGTAGSGADENGTVGSSAADGGAAENDAAAAGQAEATRAEEALPERKEAAADQASAQKADAESVGADGNLHTTEAGDENPAENADHTGSAEAVQGVAEDNSEASSVDAEKAENTENLTAAETAETAENTENAEAVETDEMLADEQAENPQVVDPSAQEGNAGAPEIVHATYQIVTTKEAEIIFAAAVMDEETGSEKEPIITKLVLKVTEFETREELREPSADDSAPAAGEEEPEQTAETNDDAKPGDGAAGDNTQAADTGEDAENKKDAETETTDADKENTEKDKTAETDKQTDEETANYPAATFEDTITVHMGTLSTDTDSAAGLDIPEKTELTVHVEADEGTFPEGTTMVLTAVTGNDLDDVAQAVEGTVEGKTKGFYAVDITFKNADGKVIEPRKPVKVSMKGETIRKATENASTEPVVVHLEDTAAAVASDADQGENGQTESKPEEPEKTEQKKDNTTAAESGDAEENTNNADESADPAAEASNVPETDQTAGMDKEPALEETQENTDASADAGKEKVLDQNAEADHLTEAVEEDTANPGNTVAAAMEKPIAAPTATVVETYRQDDTGKAADDKAANDTIMFEGNSFSIYAIVYTVDFHYEVNGKTYEFSIPGGGFVSLEHLVEVLSIAKVGADDDSEGNNVVVEGENVSENSVNTEVEESGVEENDAKEGIYEECISLNNVEVSEITKEFVANVASAEFSNPELVWVGKVDAVTTVGRLKEVNGLEVQYSAELSKDQITEINNSIVDAGDWALISKQPFISEESLTVTMENGDQFVVKVTDAQKPYKDVESLENGTYIIYNSFDSSKQAVFMKNDGTSYFTNSTTGVALNIADLSDYTWNVTKNSNGTFTIKSTKENKYINLWGNNHNNKDEFAGSNSANLTLETTSSGITISYGNKKLQRRTSGNNAGFYVHTNNSYGLTSLTFFKIENNSSGGSTGTPGIILTDDERDDLETWKETLEKFNTLTDYDKTAEVYNEENRIYKVDITADSGVMDFYKDVDLGFVLDVSNSMKFPSSLKALEDSNGNEQQVWMTAEWLNWAKGAYSDYYNRQNCFYILSDPALTSTIYKVYLDGTQWKYQDASEPAGSKIFNINDGTVFKEPYRQAYTLYYADDTKDRFTYLKDSVAYAIETLHKIVKPTEHIDDETASVRLAYNFFCKQITKSDSFKDLRDPANVNYTIPLEYRYTDSGTQQNIALYDGKYNPANWWTSPDASDGLSANEFGWDTSSDQYVILVTDGAPNGPTMNDVRTAAANLKAQYPNVKVFTIGLSTKDVDGGSKMLYDIADTVGGVRQFYEAEKAKDLECILLKILQTIMAKGLVKGTITDTIDRTFYPVDINGNPLSVGVYNSNGKIDGAQISEYVTGGRPTTAHANESFYTWEQVGDEWKITWYNQEIGWDDNVSMTGNPWTGTVYVKAKEDYLGGNLIATNDGNAQIEPTGIKLVINGTPETDWRSLENMPKIDLPVPRVNVHNLESKGNSTTWTVYKGTTVTPAEQIKALWNNILIEEVVSATDGGNHKVTTGESANVGTSGSGELFKLVDLLAEFDCRTTNGAAFDIDTLINSLGTGVNASVTSNPIIYNAYGHESGTITVTLKREAGTATLTQHNADTVGEPVEKYSLTVTYQPYSESVREEKILTNQESGYTDKSNHHNGASGRGTEEAGAITSVNTHTINVFQKGIKVTKIDKTNPSTVLPGAVFELFRVESTGTADVSAYRIPPGKYSKVGGDLTTDSNGIIMINPAIPDKDTAVTDKTVYEPNISVGDTENITHDTVFYLVEKTAPTVGGTTYSRMPGAIRFTMTLAENKGTDSTAILYDWTQTASIVAEEYLNGAEYLDEDSLSTVTDTTSDIYAFTLKNGKPTDITLIKVDKTTQNSIGGAKFRLLRGSENVDLTDSALTITAINGGATVTPEDYDFNSTTIKVVTVPEGGIRIAGLVDGTYTLIEVSAPAGYIITDSGKTFKTENGAIKNSDDTAHANEAGNIAFEVENEPGVELPATGGSGTGLLYLMGILLTALAGAGLMLTNSRRADG